jgi:hypothetical protein
MPEQPNGKRVSADNIESSFVSVLRGGDRIESNELVRSKALPLCHYE